MSKQEIWIEDRDYTVLNNLLDIDKSIFLVCDSSIQYLQINDYLNQKDNIIRFNDFSPNPTYDSVVEGIKKFKEANTNIIFAIGGGSAIDVAKCIKLFATLDENEHYLKQELKDNDIVLMVMPTTAGTGSEATRFAVIYDQGEKQSITHDSCIPSVVIMDPSTLKTVPEYQRKATMLDALCHSLESFWSVNENEESRAYATEAINIILENLDGYLENNQDANHKMLEAANLAGKAINITQTTAGHAMAYKLTSLYQLAHGHAVALCNTQLIPFMAKHLDLCIDKRGINYLETKLHELTNLFGCKDLLQLGEFIDDLVYNRLDMGFDFPEDVPMDLLVHSVNVGRLKNFPIELNEVMIQEIYERIVRRDR